MDNPGLKKLITMYENLNYLDQYGGSIVILIFVSIIIFLFVSFCISKSNSQLLIDDWPNQRCSPAVIPFAGFITHPEGVSSFEYTQQNFTYCTQQILTSITAPIVSPLVYITSILNTISGSIVGSIQAIREMFLVIREAVMSFVNAIISRLVNIMIPLQQIILGGKDILNKMMGVMTTIMFSMLGAYYSLKSLLGAVAQFISNTLIALAIVIATLWALAAFPPAAAFSVPTAIAFSVVFLLTSIPFAVMLIMMKVILNVEGYPIPKLKCFDKNTQIVMNDGSKKPIPDIKVGEILCDNNEVTAIICVETEGSVMYWLHGILVSDSHIVNYRDKWLPVSKHPDAIKCVEYNEPYLYCLNTTNKTIVINNITFTDWDEIYSSDTEYKNSFLSKIFTDIKSSGLEVIHENLDGGFEESTPVKLANGEYRKIKEVKIGDKLVNGEKVYGIVEINGANVDRQYKFILGENIIEGGPNLVFYDSEKSKNSSTLEVTTKFKVEKKHRKLYHLLTDKKTFTICNIQFCDYNAAIDIFLEKL